jgi:hypothetical protein
MYQTNQFIHRRYHMRLLMSVFAVGIAVSACHGTTEPANACVEVGGQADVRAPMFIIEYKTGTDPVATTETLGAKYSFSAKILYTAPPGFAAELSAAAVKGLQCEPAVLLIEHDSIMMLN